MQTEIHDTTSSRCAPGAAAPGLVLVRVAADGRVRWVSDGAAALGCDALVVGALLRDALADAAQGDALVGRLAAGAEPLAGERLVLAGASGPAPVVAWSAPGDEPTLALAPAPRRAQAAGWPEASRLATVLERLPVGVALADAAGRTLSMNPAGLRAHGLASPRELRETLEAWGEVFELRSLDGRLLPLDEWPLARALRGEDVTDVEARMRRRPPARGPDDGGERRIVYSAVPVRDERGEVALHAVMIHDVTERRAAEARLRASEEQYRTLLESIDEGFCVIEMLFDEGGAPIDYRFLEANAAFERHTGLVGAVGRTIRDLVPDLDRAWFERYGRVALTGEPDRFEEYATALGRWFDVFAQRVGLPEERRVALLFTDITQRRRVEAALRDSERFHRQALDSIPGLVFTSAPDGRCEFVNQTWVELTGVPAEAQLGDGWVQVLHPDDRARALAAWRAAVEERGSFELKYRVRRRDGAYEWFKVRGRPIRDEDGRVVRWFGTALSVDDLERAEVAMREREERYRLVGRATNDVIWDWDLRADRVEWNDAVQAHFGLTREELGPSVEGWTERIHPDDRARVVESIHAAIDGGGDAWEDEYRFRRRDGSYAAFLDRGYIARDPDGTAVRMIGSMLDLTERRAVEAALRESEARFRALAENMSQLAWMADPSGSLFWFNQRWFEYTGTTLEEMRGWGWKAVHPDHVERVTEEFRRCIESGEPWEDTFPLRGKDGQYRWFLSRAQPIRDEAGRVLRWFGTNTDVTAQRQAEEALREADRRKDEFLAMLAHELRNPLAPVRYAVQMMRLVGAQDPALVRARDVIDRQVAHMARLIDDLLDVSRIARGRIALRRARCDLADIVRQTVEDYRANLEASGLALTLRAPGAPVWVDGDRTRLAQMIGNLLHNAGKFTPSGGRITVTLSAERGEAVVVVEDTGVGMEPALLERLFDTFSQADQGLDRSKGGLGLGLALVKGLAELHGGAVSARSAGAGQGSTFEVRLPTIAAGGPGGARPARAAAADDRGLRVLVIEDNADAAESLVDLLAVTGHQAEVALEGRGGLEKARAAPPDVVICDIGLPGGFDGCDVARALRADPTTAGSFLVALSGYGQEEDRARTRAAGFDLHLVKPVDWSELQAALTTWAGAR